MRWLSLTVFLCLGVAILPGENGRDFAGQYSVAHVTEGPLAVNATFTLRLTNYSGRDISGARVVLETGNPRAPRILVGPSVTFANHAPSQLQVEITLSPGEFQHWNRGGAPRLTIEFLDQNGQVVHRGAELIREAAIRAEE